MGGMFDADDALSRHEWLIAPLLLQGSSSPDARILLALPVDIDEYNAARSWYSSLTPWSGMTRKVR